MQSLWGRGQLRKIMTSWIIQWESNEERYKVDEGWASLEKSLHGQWSNDILIKKINVLVWTSSRGGATMQTSPCRVFRIPILCFLKYDIPNRVHEGCLHDVNTSNSVCKQNRAASSDKRGNIWCDSLLSGKWLKKGREINSSYDKTSIWNKKTTGFSKTGWITRVLQHLTPITGKG